MTTTVTPAQGKMPAPPAPVTDIARLLAFYLPQFHPIPENDEWWGRGFTEWTNVTQATPLFKGHYQPRLPADLGFYDLRVPETRQAQADMAREYGLSGFCYYHFWLSGRRLMERPFNEVLASGEPDFPFCLCWANHDFTKAWLADNKEVMLRQEYSPEDDLNHIRYLLRVFEDPRYIRVDGKPLFLVYQAQHMTEPRATTDRWRAEAERHGFKGLFLCRVECYHDIKRGLKTPQELGFDAAIHFHPNFSTVPIHPLYYSRRWLPLMWAGLIPEAYRRNGIFDYKEYAAIASEPDRIVTTYPRLPCVMPSFDNFCRRRHDNATIFLNESPEAYERWLSAAIQEARRAAQGAIPDAESPIVFINGWNEWAEGAHLEPSLKWGRAFLEATRNALSVAAGSRGNNER